MVLGRRVDIANSSHMVFWLFVEVVRRVVGAYGGANLTIPHGVFDILA
jgi:hypothetical protein